MKRKVSLAPEHTAPMELKVQSQLHAQVCRVYVRKRLARVAAEPLMEGCCLPQTSLSSPSPQLQALLYLPQSLWGLPAYFLTVKSRNQYPCIFKNISSPVRIFIVSGSFLFSGTLHPMPPFLSVSPGWGTTACAQCVQGLRLPTPPTLPES